MQLPKLGHILAQSWMTYCCRLGLIIRLWSSSLASILLHQKSHEWICLSWQNVRIPAFDLKPPFSITALKRQIYFKAPVLISNGKTCQGQSSHPGRAASRWGLAHLSHIPVTEVRGADVPPSWYPSECLMSPSLGMQMEEWRKTASFQLAKGWLRAQCWGRALTKTQHNK